MQVRCDIDVDLKTYYYDYKNANFDMIHSVFNSDFNSQLNDLSDVCLLVNTLNEALAHYVPINECNFTNTAPVKLNGTAKSKIRQKQRLWKQYIKTNDTSIYVKFRKVSNQLRHLTRKSVRDLERSISENTKNNPKKFWKYINKKKKFKPPVASLHRRKDKDKDDLVDSDFDKAETLANQFTSVFTKESDSERDLPEHPNFTNDQQVIVSSEVILKKLKDLNVNKSPGTDSINSRILVELTDSIAPSLSIVFQNSYNTGTVPSSWKEANITSIFKKGDKKDSKNYRLISWTSISCKVMESILKDYILDFLCKNNILSIKQYGFLPGRSTILQLLNVLDK